MNHPLRCACGKLRGHVLPSPTSTRAVCYCNDCQAYARFLGTAGTVNRNGGTDVVASLPEHVHLTAGLDALACISLRNGGLLRWYASCCHTAIGNTPGNPAIPYVGVVHSCLETDGTSIESSFGTRRIAVNTKSAKGAVRATPLGTVVGVSKLVGGAVLARLSGSYRSNPFFVPGTATPIRPVRVLSPSEREQAYRRDA